IDKELKSSDYKLNFYKSVDESIIDIAKFLDISLDKISEFIEVARGYDNLVSLAFSKDDTKSGNSDSDGVALLTIHASKGLEFGHLIVCDRIGGDKNNVDKFLQEFDHINFRWLFALKVKGRENVDKDYASLVDRSKELDEDENLNKIYVALTRAVHSLIVVKNALSPHIQNKNPTYFALKEEKGEIVEPFFYIKNCTFGEFKVEKKEKICKKESKKITLIDIAKQDIKAISSNEIGDKSSINFGLAFHYTLENLSKFNEEGLNLALIKSKNRYAKFLSDEQFKSIKDRILMLLNDIKFKSILNGSEIYKEVPFKIDGNLRYIDLLALKNNGIYIIDYKTGSSFMDKHKAQVLEYKEAFKKLFPTKNINATIFYALEREISAVEV
ncbi:MAG: hypothetical protein GXZ15_05965, partial [Campylobacter sp.]|nr:hypothetical protein [Campylobacter sp.]